MDSSDKTFFMKIFFKSCDNEFVVWSKRRTRERVHADSDSL